jgi:hypothetical protein
VSLDDKVGKEKDSSISDYLVDKRSIDPEDELIKYESNSLVQSALGYLSDQEQVVITYRFGLKNNKVLTLKEIGERMGNQPGARPARSKRQAKTRLRKAFARSRAISAPSKNIYPSRTLSKRVGPRAKPPARPRSARNRLARSRAVRPDAAVAAFLFASPRARIAHPSPGRAVPAAAAAAKPRA